MTTAQSNEPQPLFRTEAAEAAVDRLGRPVNPVGLPAWVLSSFLVIVLLAVSIFLVTGTYSRKETVAGQIVLNSGTPRVVSTRAGVVDTVRVSEGQRVKVGDVLLTVASGPVLAEGTRLGQTLEDAVADQSQAQQAELAAELGRIDHQREELLVRRKGLGQRLGQLRQEIDLQHERIALSEVTFKDLKPLFDSRQIAAVQYRQYESAVLDAKQGLSALQREIQVAESDFEGTAATLAGLQSERNSLIARTDTDRALLKSRQAQLVGDSGFAVTSPVEGVVTALTIQSGAPVVPGNTLAVVVPDSSSLIVELWVPSRAVGFVRPGQEVRLMYDAFPFQRFGFGRGTITSVSSVPVPPTDLMGSVEGTEPMFRVQARLHGPSVRAYGRSWRLAPGMKLTGDMVLEERSFLQWILDPLRSAAMRG